MSAQYWELIADNLHRDGWSWGSVAYVTSDGRHMHLADALHADGRRFAVHADDILTAFLELESQCRAAVGSVDAHQG